MFELIVIAFGKLVKILENISARKSIFLTLSGWRSLSYRNQCIDLQGKLMNCFLYDKNLRHERVNKTILNKTIY